MTLQEIKDLLESTGLPVAYSHFPVGNAPPLPFICYLEAGSNNFAADGAVYSSSKDLNIELYTKLKSPELEDKVETALSSIFWEKSETYLDTEKCFQVLYEIEV